MNPAGRMPDGPASRTMKARYSFQLRSEKKLRKCDRGRISSDEREMLELD